MPQVQTNVTRHFAAPANVRASFTVSFDYTNVIYPFWLSTNLVTSTNWTLATNVSVVTVSASFPVNPAVMAEFVRVGSPTYYGPWSTATNPP